MISSKCSQRAFADGLNAEIQIENQNQIRSDFMDFKQ